MVSRSHLPEVLKGDQTSRLSSTPPTRRTPNYIIDPPPSETRARYLTSHFSNCFLSSCSFPSIGSSGAHVRVSRRAGIKGRVMFFSIGSALPTLSGIIYSVV